MAYESPEFYTYTPIVVTMVGIGSSGHTDGELAQFTMPMSIFSGENGVLYVLDTYNNLVRQVDSHNEVSRFAGDIVMLDDTQPLLDSFRFAQGFFRNGVLSSNATNIRDDVALFNRPTDGVMDSEGRIFIVDRSNHAIRMIHDGHVSIHAGGNGAGYEGGMEAMFFYPTAIAMGNNGNIYVADTGNNAIRRINASGYVTTVAGSPNQAGYNNGDIRNALFNQPMGIAVADDGTIFVADSGNHLIRVIESRQVRTLAGTYVLPQGEGLNEWEQQPIGGFANSYVNHNNYFSGAMFNMPMGLALLDDMLIVADSVNHVIRVIQLSSGEVATIGTGRIPNYANGFIQEAMFHLPQGVYVFGNNLIIADTGNNNIRKITLIESTFIANEGVQ